MPAAGQDSAARWLRWEKKLTSNTNYAASSGNPYRDLTIKVTFTSPGQPAFTGYAFWDGEEANKSVFRIRSAFASGTWTWTASCTGTSGGKNCAGLSGTGGYPPDPALNTSGTVTANIIPACPNPPCLSSLGFLKVAANGNYVTFANDQKYFWMADTAWTATAETSLSTWQTYVDDRRNKGFTTVLLAPSLAWSITPPLPAALNYSFEQVASSCGNSNLPNNCSRWKPSYWQKVDQMVEYANGRGIVVVMVGMIDPVNVTQYPSQANAVIFARNFSSRLAGNFVIFSPGFDIKLDAAPGIESTMNAVGDALNGAGSLAGAVPRHLIGNHLGGGSPISDYQKFHTKAWLDFHPFQSGHGGGCSGGLSNWQCAMKRAREAPITLSAYSPIKPRGNAEGPYDDSPGATGTLPDNRYGTRAAAYASALSGAFGVTYGIFPIYQWNSPTANLGHESTLDFKRLGDRFRVAPWYDLKPQHGWIVNQSTFTEEKKMALAVTGSNAFALAYMPDNPTMEISTSFPGLSCSAITWANPRDSNDGTEGTCTTGTGKIILARPFCSPGDGPAGKCDWVVQVGNSMSLATGAAEATAATYLKAWSAPAEENLTASILAAVYNRQGKPLATPIDVSGDRLPTLTRLPVAHRDATGHFWIVWEEASLDDSEYGFDVVARRIDANGAPVGGTFRVNETRTGNQYEPAIAGDTQAVTIAWTSYEQDGDAGGVVARRFRLDGTPLGSECLVNTGTAGHQHSPRVAANAAGLTAVAWESGREGERQRVEIQRYGSDWTATGPKMRAPIAHLTDQYLTSLYVGLSGEVTAGLATYDAKGASLGVSAVALDPSGNLVPPGKP